MSSDAGAPSANVFTLAITAFTIDSIGVAAVCCPRTRRGLGQCGC